MEDAQKTKREDVCPTKKLDVERRASSPVGLSRATVEEQIRQTTGPEYWRSLEELAAKLA